ncbi:MAG: hypothetical protein KA712_02465 [Myxococcales bacterium]|nr:hypothetical protein [Myxococcales bacterium]
MFRRSPSAFRAFSTLTRRQLGIALGSGSLLLRRPARAALPAPAPAAGGDALWQGFQAPPRSCRPHTRWWWPGNALTLPEISRQLKEMATQGMGGVEIMSTWHLYERGGTDYLSDAHLAQLKHAVREAKRLDLEVSLTFGAGWSFGGPWVGPDDRSKCLAQTFTDVAGGQRLTPELPRYQAPKVTLIHHVVDPSFRGQAQDEDSLLAVVAVPAKGDAWDFAQAHVLPLAEGGTPRPWEAPPGRWRVFGYWLRYTGQENSAQDFAGRHFVVDHLNPKAVERYSRHLVDKLVGALGPDLGHTIDSFFCDSFEIVPLPETVLWTNDLFQAFTERTGKDLRPLLPHLWHDGGAETAAVRFEVNRMLHERGLATIRQFASACEAIGVQARVQPHYRFVTEIVQSAGAVARPETEVTTAWRQSVEDPRRATVSGARYYERGFVSAEAFTFLHKDRYRASLQDLKIATDAFLRDGITQVYNHGFLASSEPLVAPSRDMPWGNPINPWMPWWKHYHHLAAYTARASHMLRQGQPVSDIAVYSPHCDRWAATGVWNIQRRFLAYGGLGDLLVRAGYDYEIINDDVLQNRSQIGEGRLLAGGLSHAVVIVPDVHFMPTHTLAQLARFATAGGKVLVLGEPPQAAPGWADAAAFARARDALFLGARGNVVRVPAWRRPLKHEPAPWSLVEPAPGEREGAAELRQALALCVPPDVSLPRGERGRQGLTWAHRQQDGRHVYFVANVQATDFEGELSLRILARELELWDPRRGSRKALEPRTEGPGPEGRTQVTLRLAPYESVFLVASGPPQDLRSDRPARRQPGPLLVNAPALTPAPSHPGPARTERALEEWTLRAEGRSRRLTSLGSWHELEGLAHFAGSATYVTTFDLEGNDVGPANALWLDLGLVGDVAEVFLEGPARKRMLVETLWMAPHRVRLGQGMKPGRYRLEVVVTNGLVNHVRGLRSPKTPVPRSLARRLGEQRQTYHDGEKAFFDKDLPAGPALAGLVGPAKLVICPSATGGPSVAG